VKYTEVTIPGIYAFLLPDGTVDWYRKFDGINWYTGHGSPKKAAKVDSEADSERVSRWAAQYSLVEHAADINGDPWAEFIQPIQT
jgi:hypothetical protein